MEEKKEQKMKLDDAQRVRVLSPGMLVAKRFFRNRLAIVGLVIIVCMFLFAFLGGALIPYSQSQVFYTTDEMKKDYAGATYITDYQTFPAENVKLPKDSNSKTILAVTTGKLIFTSKEDRTFGLSPIGEGVYIMYELIPEEKDLSDTDGYLQAAEDETNVFEADGQIWLYEADGTDVTFYEATEAAVVCQRSFTPYEADTVFPYAFYCNVLKAMGDGETKVTVAGDTYTIVQDDESSAMIYNALGKEYAYVSDMNINSVVEGVFLTPAFKEVVREAIDAKVETFQYQDENGGNDKYILERKNNQYTIRRYQETKVIDTYASPSKEHPVGTDANGMDLLARLMYGGRISLLIGFVVVIIELIIGVIVGGVAGFFGGWVDNLLMRFVDIIYCIPAIPLYMILGSIMDYYQVSATLRIYLLCVVISIIGWVGIARIVRGQILSLREQEFMVAAEATGISVKRRIFKHLIPNVIPQLIVFATMGLGDIILTEASLSFLGLGIKYPAASWGSIINAVNDSYVMTNYVFVWIPAGLLILLTVLACNFIGDGLRDAFDPKMKR